MKKIYLLLLLSLFSIRGFSATWYTHTVGNINDPNNWSSVIGSAGTSPTLITMLTHAGDIWIVDIPMVLPGDTTWTIAGTVIFNANGKLKRLAGTGSTITIAKSLSLTDQVNAIYSVQGASAFTLNVGTNMAMSGGSFFTDSAASGSMNITVNGNLTLSDSSHITNLPGGGGVASLTVDSLTLSGTSYISNNAPGGSGLTSVTVNGSMGLSGTSYIATAPTGGGFTTMNVTGSVSLANNTYITNQSGGGGFSTITINGNLSMADNSYFVDTAGGATTVNLVGNLSVTGSSYISSGIPGTPGYKAIHFTGHAPFATPQTITWTSTGASKYTNFDIDASNVVELLSNVPLPDTTNAEERLQGTLICDTFDMKGDGSQTFHIYGGANLYTGNTGGIDSSIQGCSELFSGAANYFYDGIAPQVTGLTLPAVMDSSGSVTIDNVTGVTISKATAFDTAKLNLELGNFTIGTTDSLLTMNNASSVNVDSGNFASAPTYNAFVNITYLNLGYNALATNTGNELLPTSPATTIGNVLVDKPGATITLTSSPTVNGNFTLDTGVVDASASNYNITANGNWLNYSGPGALVPELGTVFFTGTASQEIGVLGNYSTTFNNLVLTNSAGALLGAGAIVNDTLALNAGKLNLQGGDLTIGAVAAPPQGTLLGASSWVIANGANSVIKEFSADSSYLYPVGDSTVFSPILLSVNGSAFLPGSNAQVQVRNHKEPHNADTTNYLNRYWAINVSSALITSPFYTVMAAAYVPGDVVGIESDMAAGAYTGALPWLKYGLTNTATHALTSGTITAPSIDFTGIDSIPPSFTVSRDTSLCIPGGFDTLSVLTAAGDTPFTFAWYPSTGLSVDTGRVVAATPVATTTYTVVMTDGNGFTDTTTTTVTVNAAPTLDSASNSGPICSGFTINLTANNPQNVTGFLWQGPAAVTDSTTANGSLPAAYTTASGTYTVTVVDGVGPGCTMTYTTTVVVDTFPDSTMVTGAGVYCDSNTIFATVGTPDTIYYQGTTSGGTSTAVPATSMLITTLGTGTYYFRAKSALGCWGAEGSATVTINPLPNPDTAYGAGTFCDSTVIGATNGDSGTIYFQGTVSGGTSIALGGSPQKITASGTYYFRAISAAGCWGAESSVTDTINYTPAPVVVSPSSSGTFCGADTITASGGAGGTIFYEGTTAFGMDSSTAALSEIVTDTGVYYFRAENAGCWSQQDSAVAIVNPLPAQPVIITSGGSFAFCDSTTIFATNGGDGTLYFEDTTSGGTSTATPATFAFLNDTDSQPHTYYFRAQSAAGCWGPENSVTITINELPTPVTATGSGGPFCGSTSISGTDGTDPTINIYFEGNAPGGTIMGGGSPQTVTTSGTYYFRAYSTSTGCWSREGVSDDSATVLINPLPTLHNVTGGGSYCQGGAGFDIGLDISDLGINYQLYNGTDTVGPILGGTSLPLDFGTITAAGTYMVIAIDTTTLCNDTTTSSTLINVNTLPPVHTIYPGTGSGAYCFGTGGADISINGTDFNYNYQVYNDGVLDSTIFGLGGPADFGNYTDTGTYTVVAVSDSGCTTNMLGSVVISIVPLPNLYMVSGGGVLCYGDTGYHVFLSGADTNVQYQLWNGPAQIGFPLTGAGLPLDFGLLNASGTYTVIATGLPPTSCTSNMLDSAVIIVNPVPNPQILSGGGPYCSGGPGVPIGMFGSESGISYQLLYDLAPDGPAVTGTGSAFDFPLQTLAGSYSIVATNPATGCFDTIPGSVAITINTLPTVYTIFGGGDYCAGGAGFNIGLTGTQVGIAYQLYKGGVPVVGDSITGVGTLDSFGHQTAPGTYTIIATNTTTSCFSQVAGTAVIIVNSLPVIDTVTGGGSYCATGPGRHIGLTGSTIGIDYQLYHDGVTLGGGVPGINSPLDFGLFLPAGTYKVVAQNVVTGCTSNMADSATIQVNPLPTIYGMTGGGSYCTGGTGIDLGLSFADTGIIYQLYYGTATSGSPYGGGGGPLDFGGPHLGAGSYTVIATNATTSCSDSMAGHATISVNPLPPVHLVLGGGIYCISGTGVDVSLSGSDNGYIYLLYDGTTTVGPPFAGTGTSIDFGLQTTGGTYTIIAIDTTTACQAQMTDSAEVTPESPLIPIVTISAHPGLTVGVGSKDTLVANISGVGTGTVTIQWYVNGNLVPGATNDTFAFNIYYNTDSITCEVTSHGTCGGHTTSASTFITLSEGVQQVTALGSDIRLVPNPNKGVFTIKGTLGTAPMAIGDEEVYVEISDMLGQTVYKDKVIATGGNINEKIQLNSSLANGMYILNLRSGTQNNIFHFVLEQ